MKHQDPSPAFIPTSRAYEQGKFGRLFPWLPPCLNEEDSLSELDTISGLMVEGIDSKMPAGYTYLGQFIAHDLSFDPTSIKERQIDMEFLWNFRTPALDLDSLYGGGPQLMPFLFKKTNFGEFEVVKSKPAVQRVNGVAIIADPRNDENAIISQLHAAFMVLHNQLLSLQQGKNGYQNFLLARKETTWYYQWIVLRDFLPRIVGDDMVRKILKKGRKYYNWRNEPFIPLEFSAAAFRFGHSQTRSNYSFIAGDSTKIFIEASLAPFIDWSLFFFNNYKDSVNVNFLIGPFIATALHNLAFVQQMGDKKAILTETLAALSKQKGKEAKIDYLLNFALDTGWRINEKDLPFRNLLRSKLLQLPSGQAVAKAMKQIPHKIETKGFPDRLRNNTPLWYYILDEAYFLEGGAKLGPVGSRIVAEVIIGLLQGDKTSFLNQDPKWVPKIKNQNGAEELKPDFNMIDLLQMAGVYQGALV